MFARLIVVVTLAGLGTIAYKFGLEPTGIFMLCYAAIVANE